jgi:hypothetical protein
MNSELDEYGKGTRDFRLVQASGEENPTFSVVGLCGRRSPLEWSSRPPYMAGGLGFPFEVCGPSSRSVIDFRKVAFRHYREDPVILGSTGGAATVI